MAYNPMTPQERMQRAALLRAQREERLGYTPTVTEDLSRYLMSPTEQSVGSVAPVSAQRDDGTDALEAIGKGVATGLDLGANVGIGALKSLEGIFDIGASLVGTVGGWFSEDFKREVEKVVAYQAINELVENPLDELGLKHSYLNDSEIGEIIGGVAQGVGGMLPAVLVTVATGGTAAPVAVKQALSLGTMIAGAAGNASEEALNDGANLGQATNYGLVSGAIEGATEKLTGGASKWLIGKGLIKGAGNVAAQGGKRILKNMAGEAVEEGLATLVNPLAKTTYKGADSLSEYGEAEFYGDVLRDAASGALVAGAFDQTVGRVAHRAGADADIYDAQEAIDNIVNKQRAEQANGIYENGQLDADEMANLENISKTLKKASPEKRAKLIERHDLSQAFDESGEIKPEFAARFDGGTTTPQDITMGATQSGRGYNKAYYSADKRGSEAQIASEVESIQESLRNVERNRLEQERLDPSAADNITVKVFDSELSEQGKKNLANAYGFINNVSDRTRTGMSMVVVDSGSAMNGAVLQDGNTLYIDASQIEDGTYIKTMVEEVAHFSEGSESYGKLLSFIAKDEDLFSEVVGELVADGNGYGFTADTFLSLVEKSEEGDRQSLTGAEKSLANEIGAHMVAETFGNETFMQKVIKGEPTLAEKMIARVKALKNALSGNESAEARTERKRLEKAEKLWMKSVEDAGYKYVKGKLIKRRREKEEEEKKKATSSTENVQEAESESGASNEELEKTLARKRSEVVDEIVTKGKKSGAQFSLPTRSASDAAYLKAVEDGDMETAQRMVDEAAEKAGYSIKGYHGTRRDFTVFKTRLPGMIEGVESIYLAKDENTASSYGNRVIPLYAKVEKLITIDCGHRAANNLRSNLLTKEQIELVKEAWGEQWYNLNFKRFGTISTDQIAYAIHRQGEYDGIEFTNVKDSYYDNRSTTDYVVFDNTQVKSADPVTYDDDGNVIPLSERFDSSNDDIRFSLPNNVKRNANRSRSKTYTRSESNAIVDAMIGDSVFGYGEYVGTLKGKGNIVDALWVKLNSTDEKGRKKYAFKLADAVIDSMVLNLAVDDPVMEVYTDRVEKLGAYVRRLDLTSIKDELNNTGNAQHYRSRWQRYDRKGMTPDQIVSELAENGIIIEADNPADILFEIDAMYTEALQGIKDNSNLILEQVLDKAELDAYRNDLARRFLEASNELGSASKLSREYYEEYLKLSAEYEHAVELLEKDMKKEIDANTEKTMKDIEKRKQQLEREREKFAGWRKKLRESDDEFRDKMREKFRNQEKTAKLIREVVFRAQVLGSYKKGTAYSVSEYNDPTFWSNLESLSNILRAGSISVTKTRSICRDLAGWMGWIHDPNQYEGLTEEQKYDIQVIRTNLEDLSYGDKSFTVGELQTLSITLAQITNFVKSYGKIRRNGKLVEAKPYAENFIKIIEASNKIPRGLQRKFFESGFMGNFADPATLMRYADGYEEGFFTETFNEFREGAVTVAVTRMELMQEYDAFMKAHKKYGEHLAETVEFRGHKMPRATAIALWMTSKEAQAQLGLVKSGIMFRYEPTDKSGKKDANGVKVYDIPPLGDPNADYTQDEIDQFMKDLRADLEKTFTDADRSYIAIVENTFEECGEIKRDKDLELKGVTNVAGGYYFPIVRADKASSMDTESWREAVDRVNNLSMNKERVKGAKSRLFIDNVDAILKRHVNQVSLYKGIATAVDNYNVLVNLNTGSNKGAPISINERVQRTDFGKEALNYLKKLKEDIEQINRREIDDRGFVSLTQRIRGNYATYQLGANPKVWVTQLSSFVAANDVLDADSIAKGMTIANKKLANGETEVDKYCPLAKQRNLDNVAYEAQSVSARVTNKVGEVLMKPVGKVDRFVIERLWGACQVQIEKDGGAKVGTKENKTEAGKLLQKVILETQQNALPTERSSAMRSTSEIKKTLTMFSADAMKIIGRVFDGFGRYYFAKQRLKGNITDEQRKHFEAEKKAGFKQFRKATAILLTQSVLMALVALGFKALLAQLDEEEPEEIATEFAVDAVGNTLGGLPIFRDVYGFLMQGYELDSYLYSSFNDMMTSVKNVGDLAEKTINGEATSQDYAKSIRSAFYSAGQIFGLPTRNVYKYTTGIVKRVSPETGYAIDAAFTKPSIKADLKKAIEAGDTKMVARIAEIATSENYGMYSESTRKSLRKLVEAGYTVFPRTVGDTVTVDGETYELSSEQNKRFAKVYAVSDMAVEELVKLKQFKGATDEVKAKALKYVYDTYYSVAMDDLMGTDTTQKSVLFAEVLDVELLAMIAAHVSTLAADKDKDGKTVNGSRKHKIVAYVNSLNLSAAEKYMIMGYLGYKNTNGKNQVESLINRSHLSRAEKETLLANSGY